MSHPLKKLMSQTAVYGLSSIVGRLLNYLLVPLYTHLFIPSEYGIVTNLYAYVGFLIVLLTYGMETAYFRFSQSEKDYNKVFSTAITPLFLTSGIFITAMVLFSQNIASALQYEKNPEYIIWFAIIIGFEAITSIPFAKLRQENKPVKFAIYKFINIGLNIGLNLFFLLLLPYLSKNMNNQFVEYIYNPEIGIGYIFISNLLAIIITFALFIPDFIKTKIKFSSELLKKMLIYGSPLLIVGLAGMVNEVIDRILLKYLIAVPSNITDSENYILGQIGIYGANYKLSILMTLFVQAFRYAAEPFFFSHQKEQNAKQTYADVLKYFVIFGLLIFLGIMLYLDIVKYFINSRYHEGLQIVPILLLANLFLGIIYNLSLWYKLTDKTSFGALIAVGGAVVTIVLNIILIPKIGYLGSAWATFFCYFSMMVASYYFGQKYYFINYNLKKIFFYFFIAIGIYFINKYVIFSSTIVSYSFKTLLLLSFISIAFYKEDFISKLKNFRNK
jgi:O-antigen/teichoic acid export membrane protein